MSNSYVQTSSKLNLKPDQIEKAIEILDREAKKLEEGEKGYCGIFYYEKA